MIVIVQQEMLHLALAGNVFTSLDSGNHLGPKLYSEGYLVQYGCDDILFFEIPLKLEPCNKKSLELFMKVILFPIDTMSAFTLTQLTVSSNLHT